MSPITATLTTILSVAPSALLFAQSLTVPPPPRHPEQGRGSLMLEGESTLNRPQGDNTNLRSRLHLMKYAHLQLTTLSIAVGGEIDLGVSYRSDTAGLSLRVEQNRLRLGTVVTLPAEWSVDPYLALGLQTTPTESFRYNRGEKERLAKFWDPVITTESIGATWGVREPSYALSLRLGIAMEQIRAALHTVRTDDPATEGDVEAYREESGVEFTGETSWRIDSAGQLESRLALFGSFREPDVWRVESENRLRVAVGSVLAFVWQVNLRHDIRQTLRTQAESGMSVGFETKF